MSKLSVIIVTKNEAHNIEECLKSISFADEIVVFDSGSTDNTVEICKRYTHKVTVTPDWPGDGPQKNRALAQVSNDWILCLDADERVTPALAQEIQAIVANTAHAAFDIPYQSTYCGKGESHIRLFNRRFATITSDIVHCHVKTKGSVGKLHASIMHHPFHHLGALLHKMNDYSTQSAKTLLAKGKKASLMTAISHGLWSFFRGYLLRLGCLDGREGFLLAISNAQGTYYRYLKLMYLCEKQQKGEL
jgi:glycosyltransferase involved in cell wall biosynthesis